MKTWRPVTEKKAKEIVKKVQKLYSEQMKQAEKEGFHHPVLHTSTMDIKKLIEEFEQITGEDWDKCCRNYL